MCDLVANAAGKPGTGKPVDYSSSQVVKSYSSHFSCHSSHGGVPENVC